MDNHVENESPGEFIRYERSMPDDKSAGQSRYNGPTHEDVRHMIHDAVNDHE